MLLRSHRNQSFGRRLDEMKNKLCEALEIEENQLNLKATTEEGLGFTGSGEGMVVQAICMLICFLIWQEMTGSPADAEDAVAVDNKRIRKLDRGR